MDLLDLGLWVVLALVAGILGNAGWEIVRPRAYDGVSWLFRLITLNQKRSRDALYAAAASRDTQSLNLTLSLIVSGIILGALAATFFVMSAKYIPFGGDVLVNIDVNFENPPIAWVLITGLYIIFNGYLLVRFVLRLLSQFRIDQIVLLFEQAVAQLGPSISISQEKELRRSFALMRSEEDYGLLWKQIESIGESKGVALTMLQF